MIFCTACLVEWLLPVGMACFCCSWPCVFVFVVLRGSCMQPCMLSTAAKSNPEVAGHLLQSGVSASSYALHSTFPAWEEA